MARSYGFSNPQEFLEYDCPGAYQLPKNPQEVWADEWNGWDDFLGIPWEWSMARQMIREHLSVIRNQDEYSALFLRNNKDVQADTTDEDAALNAIISRLPFRPDLFYKDEWQGWEDFLGIL